MSMLPFRPRAVITGTCVVALSLGATVPAVAAEGDTLDLTLLATTDVHAHVNNFDYFADGEYAANNGTGLARVKTIVDSVRADKGADSVIYVDNGDAIQGSALGTYFSAVEPVTETGLEHPMAKAFNLLGLDTQTYGNHEFNYGLANLDYYRSELNATMLAANVTDAATGGLAFTPYKIIEREIDGRTVKVGVLGLVVPGVAVWDRAHVEGKYVFGDLVEAARKYVPELREQVDVVVVTAHSGQGNIDSVDYDPAALEHDVANNVAELVPGIDVMVAGHSHEDLPATWYTNTAGEKVLVTQPKNWARSVSEVTIPLVEQADGTFDVEWTEGTDYVTRHDSSAVADDPEMLEAMKPYHDATVEYVNTPVAESVQRMETATSRYEDTPIIDFINHVQLETVATAMQSTEYADLPVISQASPFSRTAVFPEGQVTIRDVAALYVYDNTLGASKITGAQLKRYMEHSVLYYEQVPAGEQFDPDKHTNAKTPYYQRDSGTPDYALDQMAGVNYQIDLSQPAGQRIVNLTWPDGTPVADDDEMILAINNYRQNGGSAYPDIATAPVVYNELQEIRQLLIDWASERGTIDPADFAEKNWEIITSASEDAPEDPTPIEKAQTVYLDGDLTGRAALEIEVPEGVEVIPGDFLGDGTTQFAFRQGNTFLFPEGLGAEAQAAEYTFGHPLDRVVVGDWDGDGVDTIALQRGNTFYFDHDFTGGAADESVAFGRRGDIGVAGSFDGGERDSIAVVRGNTWFVAEGTSNVTAIERAFGKPGDQPLVGDWNGDGTDTVGVRRGNVFHLTDTTAGGRAEITFSFGRSSDDVIAGGWGTDGDSVGVVR